MTVYLTDVRDRPLVNPVRQEVFGETRPASTLVEISALVIPGREDRGRVRGADPVTDPYNAAITWLDEPLRGSAGGPLAGRTLLVKDLIDTAGIRTTYGSKIFADHVPERHATIVQRALDGGAVVVGKGNLPEFAWGVLGANPWYGTVHNPLHPGKTTGGSSAGNAAALAAGLVDLGIGTDTGCSIRLPSAACGTVGLKPRWGHLPLDGVFPLCPSFDTVGPMGRSVADVALLWSVLSGSPVPEPRLDGLTVGLLRKAPELGDGRETEASDAAEVWADDLERLGARVVETTIPAPTPTCGRCSFTRLRRATARRSPRAPTSMPSRSTRSSRRPSRFGPTRLRRRTARCRAGERTRPRSTCTSVPASRSICRTKTQTSSRCACRSPRSSAG